MKKKTKTKYYKTKHRYPSFVDKMKEADRKLKVNGFIK